MNKTLLSFAFILVLATNLFGQERGLTPNKKPWQGGTVRALIVGISDYQHPFIEDLHFAHRDAEAFDQFLRSEEGGMLQDSQIVLLTNERATGGRIIAGFDWLIEESEFNDVAIIYFAGHGDVESNRLSPWGYLLPYDSPPRSYGLGAISVKYLKESIIPTLSSLNSANVILISDACHAGKLAGSAVGGSQITTQKMMEQFDNEIKILSCQSNEESIEGEQWGGGRGAFSYHLIEGLRGMANENQDSIINLFEIGRHLENTVTKEVAPIPQVPITIGDRFAPIIRANDEPLASTNNPLEVEGLSPIQNRAGSKALALANAEVATLYSDFQTALANNNLLTPEGQSAEDAFNQLIAIPNTEALHAEMKRNYAAALQEEAQILLNAILSSDVEQFSSGPHKKLALYEDVPKKLERARGLLGEEHYFSNSLEARELFFDGVIDLLNHELDNDSTNLKSGIKNLKASLKVEENSAFTNLTLTSVYGSKLNQRDSAVYFGERAIELAPSWVIPYVRLANLSSKKKEFEKARTFLDEAIKIDSNNTHVLTAWGGWHYYQGNFTVAKEYLKNGIKVDSFNLNAIKSLGSIYLLEKDYPNSEKYFQKALAKDTNDFRSYYLLGIVKYSEKKYQKAEKHLKKAHSINNLNLKISNQLGLVCYQLKKYNESEKWFLIVKSKKPDDINLLYNLACVYSLQSKKKEALTSLESAVKVGFNNKSKVENDPDFDILRYEPRYLNLFKK